MLKDEAHSCGLFVVRFSLGGQLGNSIPTNKIPHEQLTTNYLTTG